MESNPTNEQQETSVPAEEPEKSFEELLLEAEARTINRVSPGQKLEGTVVMVTNDTIFIDIGMRTEAQMPILEDERYTSLKDGDRTMVFVTKARGAVSLSLDPVMGFGDWSPLEKANEEGAPIEGRVAAVIKGGYEINISGVRCFCPNSQIGFRFVENPKELVNQTFPFKILELDVAAKNAVVSRRALIEEERQKRIAETRAKLSPGAVLPGKVVEIKPFGAFVDLGGLTGLVHISELAHQRVNRPEDVVEMNQELEVKVLEITSDARGRDRISLSLRALLPDPWDELELTVGEQRKGTVVRKSSFGIFINLAAGVDGLMPMRFMKSSGRSIDMDEFEIGQELELEVVDLHNQDRKVTLALQGWNEEQASALRPGESLKAEVIKLLPNGILVQGLEDPARGIIPKRTLKQASMKQIHQKFPPGTQLSVVLQEIDDRGRYTFALPNGEENFDRDTLDQFSDGGNLGHTPFSDFFKDRG